MADFSTSKRKNVLPLDLAKLLDDSSDDQIPEIFITPSEKSKATEEEHIDYQRLTDSELKYMISKYKRHISNLGHRTKDNGEKIKTTIRRCEAELERRRNRIHRDKDCEETIQVSDQSDDGALCRKDKRCQDSSASSTFAYMFKKKIDEDERTVNAFDKELYFINPHHGRKATQNGQLPNRGRSYQQSSSRSQQFQSPATLVDNRKHKSSNGDKKFNSCAASSLHQYFTKRTPASKDRSSTKPNPKVPSSYHLVDEDIEDPYVANTTLRKETLSDCMKDVEVYYPSRDDRDPVEVTYTDMECLAPEAWLSSTIMNFYIRYLQQSSSEYSTSKYHIFNTYFYNKLQELNHREDSFPKFRKWWKGVNLFEKAYILLPVHESAHWSLGIICIPEKEDELGPIVLHLDSLRQHDSSSIFGNLKWFLKEEWNYLRNSEVPLDLQIMDDNWENLDHRIIDRKMQVPQQRNASDCGLFVLYYMERFIKEAPERLTEKDMSMFGKQWFPPEEASNLRVRIHNLLVQEFKNAKEKDTNLSPKC